MAERMPEKFHPLATYSSERARGIMHTPEWDARMAELQREFDQWDTRMAELQQEFDQWAKDG